MIGVGREADLWQLGKVKNTIVQQPFRVRFARCSKCPVRFKILMNPDDLLTFVVDV